MSTPGQPERATQNRAGNSNVEEGLLTAYLAQVGYTLEQISRALYLLRTEAGKLR
jgi:type I restriction enzyme R subunit